MANKLVIQKDTTMSTKNKHSILTMKEGSCSKCGVTYIDQVEGDGLVDKIADLGLWPFFSSYACKL